MPLVPIPPDTYDSYGVRVREILRYGNYSYVNSHRGKNLGPLLLKYITKIYKLHLLSFVRSTRTILLNM